MDGKPTVSQWPVVAVLAGTVVSLALAAYAVRTGVKNLTVGHPPKDAANSLWHLVFLSVAAGLLSFAVVEFVKRLSLMRRLFNFRAVQKAFGAELAFPGGPLGIGQSISYSGTIRQVAAQISVQLRRLVEFALGTSGTEDEKRLALALALGIDSSGSSQLPSFDDLRRAGQLEDIQDLVDRRLDVFQIETTQRWRALMRTLGAAGAGVLSAISAWAVSSSLTAIFVAALFGILVGGPVSWITRDLTRVVERKAQF